MSNLIQHFVHAGLQIRVQGTDAEPSFCALDVCRALGIVNHRNKVAALDNDEKFTAVVLSGGQRRRIVFVTEPGLYKIIFRCNEAKIPGTAPYAFTQWVCYEVLPSIRRTQRYELQRSIKAEYEAERERRLWNVLKNMDIYTYNARRRWWGRVCRDAKHLCVYDSQNSPHVRPDNIAAAQATIRATMSAAIVADVPENQSLITQFFD